MILSGQYRIPAPPRQVWEGLTDPEILRRCIPVCEEIRKVSETHFAARVVARVGPLRLRIDGRILLSNVNPPTAYTILGEGNGGYAGAARAVANVTLSNLEDGTLLRYVAEAEIAGRLGRLASGLLTGTAERYADAFFDRFATALVTDGRAIASGR